MTRNNRRFSTLILATALTAITGSLSHAGPATYLSSDASRCEIFKSLSRDIPGECAFSARSGEAGQKMRTRGLTRGLVIHGASTAEAKPAGRQETDKELAIAMRVEFEFNSFELTAEAKQVLDRVAEVLNHELMSDKRVMIEGHADAVGSNSYNLTLSQARAGAVRAYLEKEHQVVTARLDHVGKGEAELYDASNPTAAINRRVEFRNLSQ